VAVILCNTGIALLAYMDGVNQNKTLFGVVLAAAAGQKNLYFTNKVPGFGGCYRSE